MNIGVILQFHDYEIEIIYIDTTKLVESNPVDKAILKELKKKSPGLVFIEGRGWDDLNSPFKGTEPGITEDAVFETKPKSIEDILLVEINFD